MDNQKQLDRNCYGGLYDRGHADSYYGRRPDPHWYPAATYVGDRITKLTSDEVAEYMKGYNDNEATGDKKNYD